MLFSLRFTAVLVNPFAIIQASYKLIQNL